MSPDFRDLKPLPSPDGVRSRIRRGWRLLGGGLLIALGVLAFRSVGAALTPDAPPPASGPETDRTAGPEEGTTKEAVVAVRPRIVVEDTLQRGRSLGHLLRRHGLRGRDFTEIVAAVREVESPRRLRPGVHVRLTSRVPERLSEVVLGLDRDRSIRLTHRPDGWSARLDSVPVTIDTIRVGGLIRSSLWEASLFGEDEKLVRYDDYDEHRGLLLTLANQIFAWQVDFYRDIREGDAFRVVIERELRPDGTIRRARVLAAEFQNAGRSLVAVRFEVPDGPVEYYDEEGEATRKSFLRMPLRFGRRTSGFTRRRFHPVLKSYRAHRGVDYGAPAGTPVRATGAGVVTRAHRWNGYGLVVEIRHNGVHRTRYAHLRGFARGIRSGVRVEQGEVIGYVGSTGLSTAPHVHYEFLVNGAQRDPARVDLPPGDPVPPEHAGAYRSVRRERLQLLDELAYPPEARVAARGGARVED